MDNPTAIASLTALSAQPEAARFGVKALRLARLIDAGLPIVQCLDMLSSQAENKHFGKALNEIKDGVESGKSLSDSMGLHPKIFDELFRNLVAAGEAGGILDLIFRRLATYLEKAAKLRAHLDPNSHNGGVMLGLNGLVVKSHGGADELSFGHAIEVAMVEAEKDVPERIAHLLEQILEQPM